MNVLGKRKTENINKFEDFASEGGRRGRIEFHDKITKELKRMNSENLTKKKNKNQKISNKKSRNFGPKKIFKYGRKKKLLNLEKLGSRLAEFSSLSKKKNSFSLSDNEFEEFEFLPPHQNTNKSSKTQKKFLPKRVVKRNLTHHITEVKLAGEDEKRLYPVIRDSDLKMPSNIQSMLNKMTMDDDNKTTESLLDKAMRKTYRNLTKAVEEVSLRRRRPSERGVLRSVGVGGVKRGVIKKGGGRRGVSSGGVGVGGKSVGSDEFV